MPSPKIAELQEIIQIAQEEIRKIQSACPHPTYTVGMWSWRPGAFNPARICNVCNQPSFTVTAEESEECWRQFNGSNNYTIGDREQSGSSFNLGFSPNKKPPGGM